jgi:hypothetical protein
MIGETDEEREHRVKTIAYHMAYQTLVEILEDETLTGESRRDFEKDFEVINRLLK